MENTELRQMDEGEIYDDKMRLVKSWASVDIRDTAGENIPMLEFRKMMPIIMDRGGLIMDQHTSWPIGRILNYEFAKNAVSETEGLKLLWKVFDNYNYDDQVWEEIKSGKRKGLSFGGKSGKHNFDFSFSKEPTKILTNCEGFEFSSVGEPANQLSLNEEANLLAKCKSCIDKNKNKDNMIDAEKVKSIIERNIISKPFAGYKNFDACVSQNSDKKNPEGYCAEIMRNAESKNGEKGGKSELLNQRFNDKAGVINLKIKKGDSVEDKTEVQKSAVSAEEFAKMQKEISNLSDVVKSLSDNVGKITRQSEEKPEEEKPEDEKPEEKKKETGEEDEEDEDEDGKDTSRAEEKKKSSEELSKTREEIKKAKTELEEAKKEIEIVKAKRPDSSSINNPNQDSGNIVLKVAQNKTQMTWAGIEKIAKGENNGK